LGGETSFYCRAVVIEILKQSLCIFVRFLEFFLFHLSPVVVQNVISQDPNVFVRTLLASFSDNPISRRRIYSINQPV
jgi:hypothetical protein